MIEVKITNAGLLAVETGDKTEYGCNQEWYDSFWKKNAGCGPSVTSTIIGYIDHRFTEKSRTQQQWLTLMDDVWEDVTPTMRGLPSTALLVERIVNYLKRYELNYRVTSLDIPGKSEPRPRFEVMRDYIIGTLSQDVPVALLTLDPGEVKTLDEWHWTIIPSIQYDDDCAAVVNYNCGHVFDVDIKKWYETTRMGGGLVSILP